MKQILLLTIACSLIFLHGTAQTKKQVWSSADRTFLVEGLKSSQANLLKETKDLSEQQLHFKPDSTQWSIAEVLEHVGVYEELLNWDLINNQYTEERPDLVVKVKGVDSAMSAYATDPQKGQAPHLAQPLGRFQYKNQLLQYFNRFRGEVIKLIEETKADFRLHFVFRPEDWGIWHIRDLHQYTLLWIAHTERHLNQIKRIKSHPQFPK